MNRQQLRGEVLRRRGLKPTTQGHLAVNVQVRDPPRPGVTPLMRLLEIEHNKSIEELLSTSQPIEKVASILGRHKGTISKWRKKLGLT